MIDKYIKNMEEVFLSAMVTPNFKNGKQYGFKVKKIKKEGFFRHIRLANNDVLLEINNIRLSSPVSMMNFFYEFEKEIVNLTIERKGKVFKHEYTIN